MAAFNSPGAESKKTVVSPGTASTGTVNSPAENLENLMLDYASPIPDAQGTPERPAPRGHDQRFTVRGSEAKKRERDEGNYLEEKINFNDGIRELGDDRKIVGMSAKQRKKLESKRRRIEKEGGKKSRKNRRKTMKRKSKRRRNTKKRRTKK